MVNWFHDMNFIVSDRSTLSFVSMVHSIDLNVARFNSQLTRWNDVSQNILGFLLETLCNKGIMIQEQLDGRCRTSGGKCAETYLVIVIICISETEMLKKLGIKVTSHVFASYHCFRDNNISIFVLRK